MKKLNVVLLTFALFAATAVSAQAETKIATVDMKKLFTNYWKRKSAESLLDTRKLELRKELKDMAEGLEKAQTDYKKLLEQANDTAISADEREKRRQAATDKVKEMNSSKLALEQFQRQAESQLADQSQRMSSNIVGEIQKVVAEKAKASGYTLVLNTTTVEVVVYSDSTVDISDVVLAQLNAGAPIDVTKPAGAPAGSPSQP